MNWGQAGSTHYMLWWLMSRESQFSELMDSINYVTAKIRKKVWNLAEYYNYMAEFFDYIELPHDAEEHRVLARMWEIENLD